MSNISRSTVSIRFFGAKLDPEYLSQRLGCLPSSAAKTGEKLLRPNGKERIVRKGFWLLDYGESDDIVPEEKIELLLGKLTDDLDVWREITKGAETADIFCGLFIDEWNEGFMLSPSLMRKISDRHLEVGFDIYSPNETWNAEKAQKESAEE